MRKRIAIIGGGLASLHLAYLLKDRPDLEITIYEATDRLGGKIKTVKGPDGYLHEMGACYITPAYKDVVKLFRELGCDIDHHLVPVSGRLIVLDGKKYEFGDWVFEEYKNFPSLFIKYLPRRIAKAIFYILLLLSLRKYLSIHRKFFGVYNSFMPPKLPCETRKKLSVSFKSFLEEHKLHLLIPLLKIFQTAQGYGYIVNLPAYYGMLWCSPKMMSIVREQILGRVQKGGLKANAFLISIGFEYLIKLLSEKIKAHVKLSSSVTKIARSSSGVKIESNGKQENYDFVVLACPYKNLEGVLDYTPKEERLLKKMDGVILTAHLMESDYPPSPNGITSFADALEDHKKLKLLTLRYSKHFFSESASPSKLHVVYHLQPYSEQTEESVDNQTISELKTLAPSGPVTIHAKGSSNLGLYCPHYGAQGIIDGYPWELLEAQGENRTLYIGASASFEAVEAILDYNLNLMKKNGPLRKMLGPESS